MTSNGGAHPWLTVITVVKDAPDDFARTLDSVAAQDLHDVEYLVIDGSQDVEAVPAILPSAPHVPTHYSWVSPAGIYPAMNAGLAQASGRYVFFANAGDVFHAPDILSRVHAVANRTEAEWLFGPVEILQRDGRRVITPAWDYAAEKATAFSRGHFPSHQGTFASRALLTAQGGFDTSYSIVADYAAFLRMSLVADPVHLDFVIATFAEGGVSTTRWQESFRQFHRARRQILEPHGVLAVREAVESARQYAMVFASREIVGRVRGRRG